MKTEEGEIEVDENDDGEILLGGVVLSFDSWAKMTKTKKDGVVSTVQNKLEEKNIKAAKRKAQRSLSFCSKQKSTFKNSEPKSGKSRKWVLRN